MDREGGFSISKEMLVQGYVCEWKIKMGNVPAWRISMTKLGISTKQDKKKSRREERGGGKKWWREGGGQKRKDDQTFSLQHTNFSTKKQGLLRKEEDNRKGEKEKQRKGLLKSENWPRFICIK